MISRLPRPIKMILSDLIAALEQKLASDRTLAPGQDEIQRRRTRVATAVTDLGADAFVGFSVASIRYLTGWATANTERPVAVIVGRDGSASLFAPHLRTADAAAQTCDIEIVGYPEYPGETHPIVLLGRRLSDHGHCRLVLETAGYESPFGYRGPQLAQTGSLECVVQAHFIEDFRMVKSPEEIALIRHAGDWAMLAHGYLHQAVAAGMSESVIGGAASGRVMRRFRETFAGRSRIAWPAQVAASFGGQVGVTGTADHAHRLLDPVVGVGDPLISRVTAYVGGYYCDVERSIVCGSPSPEFARLFSEGVELQEYALTLIKPGVPVAEIDRSVQERVRQRGLHSCWRHHVGHSVGLLERERPYLDIGSEEILEPGMVVTVEPGLYALGVGGFRHSDCVVVTATGHENLTPYPRDLDFLSAHHHPAETLA